MSILSEKIRKKLEAKKKKLTNDTIVSKEVLTDIIFVPSSSSAAELTRAVNTRIKKLLDKNTKKITIIIDNTDIKYIDKSIKTDFYTLHDYDYFLVGDRVTRIEETSTLKSGRTRNSLTFYMVIITYTKDTKGA